MPQDPLFDAPAPRRTHFTLWPDEYGYIRLRVSVDTDVPRRPEVTTYERLTADEALDVIEATVYERWPAPKGRGRRDGRPA